MTELYVSSCPPVMSECDIIKERQVNCLSLTLEFFGGDSRRWSLPRVIGTVQFITVHLNTCRAHTRRNTHAFIHRQAQGLGPGFIRGGYIIRLQRHQSHYISLSQRGITAVSDSCRANRKQRAHPRGRDAALVLARWTPLGGPIEVLGTHLFFLFGGADGSYLLPPGA